MRKMNVFIRCFASSLAYFSTHGKKKLIVNLMKSFENFAYECKWFPLVHKTWVIELWTRAHFHFIIIIFANCIHSGKVQFIRFKSDLKCWMWHFWNCICVVNCQRNLNYWRITKYFISLCFVSFLKNTIYLTKIILDTIFKLFRTVGVVKRLTINFKQLALSISWPLGFPSYSRSFSLPIFRIEAAN